MQQAPQPSGRIYRHAGSVRICHWINVVAVGYLIVSGVHIFLDFPELYWGKVGFQGYPAAFRLADWGISWEQAGRLGNRRWGRNYHFLFAWVLVINGLVYVVWGVWRRHFRNNMLPSRSQLSVAHLAGAVRDRFRFRAARNKGDGTYNALQRVSYTGLIFVVMPALFLTGLAQMPAFTAIAPWMIDAMGGRQSARTLHVIGTVVVVLFVVVHLLEVVAAGFVNEVRAMITGRYRLPDDETPAPATKEQE